MGSLSVNGISAHNYKGMSDITELRTPDNIHTFLLYSYMQQEDFMLLIFNVYRDESHVSFVLLY